MKNMKNMKNLKKELKDIAEFATKLTEVNNKLSVIHELIRTKYGDDVLTRCKFGSILLNDSEINEMFIDYYRIVGLNTDKRVFKINLGDTSKNEAEKYVERLNKWHKVLGDDLKYGEIPDIMKPKLTQIVS
jgi:hypothetical protein